MKGRYERIATLAVKSPHNQRLPDEPNAGMNECHKQQQIEADTLLQIISGGAVGCAARQGGAGEAARRGAQPPRLAAVGETKSGQNDRVPKVVKREYKRRPEKRRDHRGGNLLTKKDTSFGFRGADVLRCVETRRKACGSLVGRCTSRTPLIDRPIVEINNVNTPQKNQRSEKWTHTGARLLVLL